MREYIVRYWDERSNQFIRANLKNRNDLYNMHVSFKSGASLNSGHDNNIINMCTGYKDKNGKDIYEGDLLGSIKNPLNRILKIFMDEKCGWVIGDGFGVIMFYPVGPVCMALKDLEIIGNEKEGVKPNKKEEKRFILDKNGTKVYAGDKVKCDGYDNLFTAKFETRPGYGELYRWRAVLPGDESGIPMVVTSFEKVKSDAPVGLHPLESTKEADKKEKRLQTIELELRLESATREAVGSHVDRLDYKIKSLEDAIDVICVSLTENLNSTDRADALLMNRIEKTEKYVESKFADIENRFHRMLELMTKNDAELINIVQSLEKRINGGWFYMGESSRGYLR